MSNYFAYIRVSTVKQGEHGSSLQEQKSAIEAHALRQSLSIVAWFEEKETAAKQGRAVFSRMLAQLEQGVAQGLIVHKIDRSARNLRDWANLGDLIDRGIDVQFAHDSIDLRSRGGRLSADIQAVVAADYVRNLREEVKKGYYGRLKQGLYPLPAPIGYIDKGKGKPKEPDPIRAPLVRLAFELYARGTMGLKDLRIELELRGLRAPRSGNPLSVSSLAVVLKNPFYVGLIYIRRTKEMFKGVHEPLVPKALFERVQAILQGKRVAKIYKHDYLFRLLVRCGACGFFLVGERHKQYYVYYRCHGVNCKNVCVKEDILDHAVQMELRLLQWDEREQSAVREEAALMTQDTTQSAAQLYASLRMRLGKYEDRLNRLTDAYVDQTIDKELFENRKRYALYERRELLDQIENLSADDIPANKALAKLELGNAAYFGYRNGNRDEKRDTVESVCSNFFVQGKNPVFALKSPYLEISKWRKNLNGAPSRISVRQRARKLLEITMAVAEEERKESVAEKRKEHHSESA